MTISNVVWDKASPDTDKTVITLSITFIKSILTDSEIILPDTNIILRNNISLEDRIRIGNWFMQKLAIEVGQFEAPMTTKELIEKLQELDPSGELEVTSSDGVEILDVEIEEAGAEKWLKIV